MPTRVKPTRVKTERVAPYAIPTAPYAWRIWRRWRGQRTIAGDYATRVEAERGIQQIKKLFGDSELYLEFIGTPIRHCGDRGKPL